MSNKFKSKYGIDLYINGAQYLAEIMCERIAEKDGKKLTFRFWQTDEWKKVFQLQIIKANELLKSHDLYLILKALKLPEAKKIYSLGLKAPIEKLIKKASKIQGLTHNLLVIDEAHEWQSAPPRPSPTRKNTIGDLDG